MKGVTAVTEIISFQLAKKGKGKALDLVTDDRSI